GPLDQLLAVGGGVEQAAALARVVIEALAGQRLGLFMPARLECPLVHVEACAGQQRDVLEVRPRVTLALPRRPQQSAAIITMPLEQRRAGRARDVGPRLRPLRC